VDKENKKEGLRGIEWVELAGKLPNIRSGQCIGEILSFGSPTLENPPLPPFAKGGRKGPTVAFAPPTWRLIPWGQNYEAVGLEPCLLYDPISVHPPFDKGGMNGNTQTLPTRLREEPKKKGRKNVPAKETV